MLIIKPRPFNHEGEKYSTFVSTRLNCLYLHKLGGFGFYYQSRVFQSQLEDFFYAHTLRDRFYGPGMG